MRNCNSIIVNINFAQIKVALLRLMLIWIVSFYSYQAIAQPDLKVITEDWAPYNYEENGELKGFSIEIVQAIMDELGEEYPISIYPGVRGDRMLETLPNVMYFSLFRTPEREAKFKWIGPISQEAIYFYKRKDNAKIYRTIDDVKKANNITVPYKGLVANKVDELGITNVIKLSARDRQFSLLFSNRAELAVNISPLGVVYYLKQIDKAADALVPTQVKLLEFPLYIACSKEIPDSVIQRWQAALDKVKASDKYEQIYSKYLM
ncbi:substrate-binding periplasmic protein [Neptuniibacter sp. QD37_11]|uniref:substrate-binding periplasmic protein n=1 Tax=Neptuniibacter sp. QD37_11 TaxID=3398209 RepID=UPI0039F5C80F